MQWIARKQNVHADALCFVIAINDQSGREIFMIMGCVFTLQVQHFCIDRKFNKILIIELKGIKFKYFNKKIVIFRNKWRKISKFLINIKKKIHRNLSILYLVVIYRTFLRPKTFSQTIFTIFNQIPRIRKVFRFEIFIFDHLVQWLLKIIAIFKRFVQPNKNFSITWCDSVNV